MSRDAEGRLKQLAFGFGLALVVCFVLPWLDRIYPTSSLHAWELAARVPRAGKLNAYFYLVGGLVAVVLSTSLVSHESRATGLVVLGLAPFILVGFVGLGSMGPGGTMQMTAIIAVVLGLLAICVAGTVESGPEPERMARALAATGATIIIVAYLIPARGTPAVVWIVRGVVEGAGPLTSLIGFALVPLLAALAAGAMAITGRTSGAGRLLRRSSRLASISFMPGLLALMFITERMIPGVRETSYFMLWSALQWLAGFVWVSYGLDATLAGPRGAKS